MNRLAATRFLCQCLQSTEMLPSFDMLKTTDWPLVLQIAGEQLVTPALAGALARSGQLSRLSSDYRDYLEGMRTLNQLHNATLQGELQQVIQWMNRLGIAPLLLKGAITLVTSPYPGSEDRVIGDLDLLVPEESLARACQELVAQGYQQTEGWSEAYLETHHHAPPLMHPTLPVTVELHRWVVEKDFAACLPVEALWTHGQHCVWQGVELLLPDTTDWLLHTFVHDQLQHRGYHQGVLALRPLLEFVGLWISQQQQIDWERMVHQLGRDHALALAAYLVAANRLFGQPFPNHVSVDLRAYWHYALVSLCIAQPNRLHAFERYHFSYWFTRLQQLPRRLLTPAWYRMKYQALRRGEPW